TTFVDISQDIDALKPGLVALRRELHQHPELAFEEVWTAATLAGDRQYRPRRRAGCDRALRPGGARSAINRTCDLPRAITHGGAGRPRHPRPGRHFGQAYIIKHWRNRFSDDFGLFMAAAPSCLMLLGTANPDK